MKLNRSLLIALTAAHFCLPASADDTQKAAIVKQAEAFVEAYHKGDAAALAAFWTPNGDYVDQTGQVLKGRKAIEDSFAAFFKENKGAKLRIEMASVQFPTPDTAIEDGVTAVLMPDGLPPSRARYTTSHVKIDGKWFVQAVRESPYAPPSNYAYLAPLSWMIGEWQEEKPGKQASHVAFHWAPDQNFILSSHTVEVGGVTIGEGSQRIGWDPSTKKIRSWIFESDGAFGEGSWSGSGDKWSIETSTVLRDGKKITGTTVVTRGSDDTITWQMTKRTLDGKSLPDGGAIKMKRVNLE